MRIARLLSPVHSLGPGDRVVLWTQGCTKHCVGCISPELQPTGGADADERLLAELLVRTADANACTGLTLSGGDPFEQSEALLKLLEYVRPRFSDILVYTGFTLSEIGDGAAGSVGIACLELIDVLIDGRYIDERNRPDCVLRGSDNQIIHFLHGDAELTERYSRYLLGGRVLETFVHGSTTVVTGILNREV